MLFLTGGPSQIETFDPKMTAPSEFRSVTGEVKSNLAGVTLGGTFEKLANHVDKLAPIRSFSHEGDGSRHARCNPIDRVSVGGCDGETVGDQLPRDRHADACLREW